ncbi:hypothetical protein E4H04_10685 [Candidatus Bathyarchaeota archaeon]|nr:MAG: hypothetical protein E4H04_10685 [Candidatus Bathyarchaeota archaeon]
MGQSEKIRNVSPHEDRNDYLRVKNGIISITQLKQWARETLPHGSVLSQVLLHQNDSVSTEEFLIKIPIWLKLCDLEGRR